jgi:hypothetical protein
VWWLHPPSVVSNKDSLSFAVVTSPRRQSDSTWSHPHAPLQSAEQKIRGHMSLVGRTVGFGVGCVLGPRVGVDVGRVVGCSDGAGVGGDVGP